MVDHDQRREAMKRQRSQAIEGLNANQEMGCQRVSEIFLEEISNGEVDDDNNDQDQGQGSGGVLRDLCCSGLNCIAKAA